MNTSAEFNAFLTTVRKETGIEAFMADESGLVSVRVEDAYNLNLQFVAATGKVLCFVEVTSLPHDAPKSVYRDLLVGGLFGRDTAGGYFAVDPDTDTVVYNYFFDFEKISKDVDDFVSTLEKILQLCSIWAERIRRSLSGGEQEEPEDAGDRHAHRQFSGSMIRA